MTKRLLAMAVVAVAFTGCGGDKKADVPTNLNQPLPPPPVGSGGGGKKADTGGPHAIDK
jgi:hypothetical protein